MKVTQIYAGSDGAATREYCRRLQLRGPLGEIAMNLFRAQKCSARAKKYHGGIRGVGSYRSLAYDRKAWSLEQLCLALWEHGERYGLRWGWAEDAAQPKCRWVLYVDLPEGQVSFHSPERYAGLAYAGSWDGVGGASEGRILQFCDRIWNEVGFAGADATHGLFAKQEASA